MKAVILVGHGSRSKQSNQQFIQFAMAVQGRCNAPLFRYAFLELATPTILDEIKACVDKGANEIIVFPLLLLSAGHAKFDIPNEVAKAKRLYPGVTFRIEKPLGIQDVLITILAKRLLEKQFLSNEKSLIVFVGRGSNDSRTIRDFEKVGQLLRRKLCFPHVKTSYLVGGPTSFTEAISKAKDSHYEQVFVLPYLLFHGILLKKIEQAIISLDDQRFIMCSPLGADETLVDLISRIINKKITYKNVI